MPTTSPSRTQRPLTPRWVRVFIAVALLLAAAFVVAHLLGLGLGPHIHSL